MDSLLAVLRDAGCVDIGGHPLYREFYASWSDEELLGHVVKGRGPVLLVTFAERLSQRFRQLIDELTAEGLDAGSAAISQQIDWWFPNVEWTPDERRPASAALIDTTAAWLENIHSDAEAATS